MKRTLVAARAAVAVAVAVAVAALSRSVFAGEIVVVPGDVSVSMTAFPATDLHTGDVIDFTLTVTNHGPLPVEQLELDSSPIVDELDLSNGHNDCGLQTVVVDTRDGYFYYVAWTATGGPPSDLRPALNVGETRSCHFAEALGTGTPRVFPFGFSILASMVDPDPSNNSASVNLMRAGTSAQPVPSNSTWAQLCLVLALMALGLWKRNPTWRQ